MTALAEEQLGDEGDVDDSVVIAGWRGVGGINGNGKNIIKIKSYSKRKKLIIKHFDIKVMLIKCLNSILSPISSIHMINVY